MEGEGFRGRMESEGWRESLKGNGCLIMEALHYFSPSPRLKLFLPISSSWVKIRLNSKNQLPCLESGYHFFYGTPIGVNFGYFIYKVFRKESTS